MAGLFSARVIGPAGEEIYTDKLGRVKAQFFWDIRPQPEGGDHSSSMVWLRVIQPWAGPGWGWQFLPRVGTEVAVAFMECDPDRPVVVGGLYNGDQTPPFELPDRKTVSGIRTRSSSGGGRSDYSELSIDDAKGSELVLLHAQKDLQVEVENDETLTVNHCRIRKVGQDETVSIGNDQSIKITSNRTTQIETGNDSLKLDTGDRSVTLSIGNLSWKADLGAISGEAMQSIELKVGGNSLKIDQTGVTISGIIIKLSGQAMLDVKSPLTSVNGDGMLILKGGLVMLN
jgi:type VI secretion system secreted protein VgrG